MVKVCTYDNPKTMARECWQDGKLLYAYSFKILPPYADTPIPSRHYFFGANIGPWNVDQLIGDREAIGENV